MQKLISWILSLLGLPQQIYHAQFGPITPIVQLNLIDAGPLMVSSSGVTGENPHPIPGTLSSLSTAGLQLSITKNSDAHVVVMCALAPVPPLLPKKFTMSLRGSIDSLAPSDESSQWAVTVVVRNSDNLGDANTKFVGATHQVRNIETPPAGVQIALGAGSGTVANTIFPPIKQDLTDPLTAYPDWSPGRFVLQTDIDSELGHGWSRLITPGKTWPERMWAFQFPQITGVGFSLAIVSGSGTARAMIYDFSISTLPWHRWFIRPDVPPDVPPAGI